MASLRQCRIEAGLTLEKMGIEVGAHLGREAITGGAISHYETHRRGINIVTALAIIAVLKAHKVKCTIADLTSPDIAFNKAG